MNLKKKIKVAIDSPAAAGAGKSRARLGRSAHAYNRGLSAARLYGVIHSELLPGCWRHEIQGRHRCWPFGKFHSRGAEQNR